MSPTLNRFPISRWFRGLNPWALDAVLGSFFTVAALVALFANPGDQYDYADVNAGAVLLALGFSLPFFVRRRAPFAATLVSLTSLVLLACFQYPAGIMSQMFLVGAYSVGSWVDGRRRLIAFIALVLAPLVVAVVGIPDSTTANLLLTAGIYAGAFFCGTAMRNRRLYMQQLEERAALLERERDEEAKRAVADERLRIAQELHDVVAHSMGVIAVQAGVGAHVIDNDPAEAKRSLEAISLTSRSTLTEIRRLLGVLRADEGAGYQPAPGLVDLDRLVADVDSAGITVNVEVEGTRHDVPPGVDLTAYRIVQEALTNVLKHAGPAQATVRVGYEPAALRLEITDNGRGVNGRATDGGHGLLGMRERVGVYGGTLEAGPVTGGGFRVRARLPYGEAE